MIDDEPSPRAKYSRLLPVALALVGLAALFALLLCYVGHAQAWLALLVLVAIVIGPPALVMALRAWHVRAERRFDRYYRRLCAECGYDLRASKERCPECGTPIGKDEPKRGIL